MVLSSIGKCPPVEFWRGFWSSWARFASNEASRSEAGDLMDTLENGPEPSFKSLPAPPPEPAAAAEPPAPVVSVYSHPCIPVQPMRRSPMVFTSVVPLIRWCCATDMRDAGTACGWPAEFNGCDS